MLCASRPFPLLTARVLPTSVAHSCLHCPLTQLLVGHSTCSHCAFCWIDVFGLLTLACNVLVRLKALFPYSSLPLGQLPAPTFLVSQAPPGLLPPTLWWLCIVNTLACLIWELEQQNGPQIPLCGASLIYTHPVYNSLSSL